MILPKVDQAISISDDDLCATCTYCQYNPGDKSTCIKGWPGIFNDDLYVIACNSFTRIGWRSFSNTLRINFNGIALQLNDCIKNHEDLEPIFNSVLDSFFDDLNPSIDEAISNYIRDEKTIM